MENVKEEKLQNMELEDMTAQDIERMRENRRRAKGTPYAYSPASSYSSYNSGRRFIPNKNYRR